MLLNRLLFKVILGNHPIEKDLISKIRTAVCAHHKILRNEAVFLFSHGTVSNEAYISEGKGISILMKNGEIKDIALASDLPNIKALSKIVKKSYLCYPKNVSLSIN